MQALEKEGFLSWSKREFRQFVAAYAAYGDEHIEKIAGEIGTKSVAEVEAYCAVFNDRCSLLSDYATIKQRFDRGRKERHEVAEKEMLIGEKSCAGLCGFLCLSHLACFVVHLAALI